MSPFPSTYPVDHRLTEIPRRIRRTRQNHPAYSPHAGPDALDQPLAGSVAVVTGGGRGVGLLTAHAFAAAGARVGLVARSGDELTRAAAGIEAAGGVAHAAVADVLDEHSMARALKKVRRALGPVDLLVNNAGVIGPFGPLWEVDAEDWWQAMEVNVLGTLVCTRLVLPEMVARHRGRILNMTSVAGAHRWPLASAYSVSKAAVVKLTENLARETNRHGISVFSVHPGLLPLGMSDTVKANLEAGPYERQLRDWVTREFEEGRGADPAAAGKLLVRLAAGEADALSGRHISVHDDLEVMVRRADEVQARDLYVLRPEPLGAPADLAAVAAWSEGR